MARSMRSPQAERRSALAHAQGQIPVVGASDHGRVVSGYAEIDVADLDEALRIVKTWPGCPVVEIRPVES
jgi:hypothetical protein